MANLIPDSSNFNVDSVAEIQPTDKVLASFCNGYVQQMVDNDAALKARADRMNHTVQVTLSANAWTGTGPVTQAKSVSGVTSADSPDYVFVPNATVTSMDTLRAYRRECSYLYQFVTSAGTVTFYAYQTPAQDIIVELKGV